MKIKRNDTFFWWIGGCLVLAVFLAWCRPAHAGTAILYAEVVRGMNKICYYRHHSGTITRMTRINRLCPAAIELDDE